ncbi:MAG: hypothetical protein WBB25_08600 [Sulfitobacter sp.]
MSPPDTNLEKQKRRHIGPLIGMALVVIIAVSLIVYWIGEEVATAPTTEQSDDAGTGLSPAQIDEGAVDVPDAAPVEEVDPQPDSQ